MGDGQVSAAKRSQVVKAGIMSSVGGSLGNVTVTGVGFKPKSVEFFWVVDSATQAAAIFGYADNTGIQVSRGSLGTGTATITNNSRCLLTPAPNSNTTTREATLVSFNADGFTINFTKVSNPTDIGWVARA